MLIRLLANNDQAADAFSIGMVFWERASPRP